MSNYYHRFDSTARPLTPREGEAMELICQGAPIKEMAARMNITRGRAKNLVHSILEKLGASNRAQAVYNYLKD